MQAYKQLEDRFTQITALKQIDSLLDWDRSVLMPEAAVNQRARQVEVLNIKIHEMQTDPQVGEWLAKVDKKALSPWQAANLRIMEWQYKHATAVPADLVARKMNQETRTEVIWRKARAENNFAMVQGELANLLSIVREHAAAKSEVLGTCKYGALMDSYAPGMSVAEVDAAFEDVADFLPSFINEVLDKQQEPLPLGAPFDIPTQQKLCQQVCELIGYTPDWGRLDISLHPFSSGIGNDVRITTRYKEEDFTDAMQGVAHEAGHGFYDHNTPAEWHHQPVGASQNMGMAIHESQSLSIDMQMGRSLEYWQFMAPHVQKAFGRTDAALSAENLHRHVTRVSRSFIRVEADEVTYPAHVILRYRLERAMVEGKLDVKDLPDAWRAGMRELIGAEPPSDRLGCLQDIHWYFGAFGYFPAYALGAFIAAQLADKMKRDIPDVLAQVARGNITAYTGWLKDNVQAKACLLTPPDLIREATGQPFSTYYFKKHVTERYLGRQYEGKAACSDISAQEATRRA